MCTSSHKLDELWSPDTGMGMGMVIDTWLVSLGLVSMMSASLHEGNEHLGRRLVRRRLFQHMRGVSANEATFVQLLQP